MGQTMESQLQSDVIYGPVRGVKQGYGIFQAALQHILMQCHAGMLNHQLVQIVGIVVQIRTDLGIGDASGWMSVNILDDLQHGIIVNVTQLQVSGQIN